MRQNPKALEVYRHFKGKYYQIIAMAMHTETREDLVIYRPLYDNQGIYARPLNMFMSEVDHEKYPEVKQQYRFELVDFDQMQPNEIKTDGIMSGEIKTDENKTSETKINKVESSAGETETMGRKAQYESQQNEPRQNESHQSELRQNEPRQNESQQNELCQNEPSQYESQQNEFPQEDMQQHRDSYGGGRSAEVRPKREHKEYDVMDFLDADTYEHKLEILRLLRNKLDDNMVNTIAASLDLEPKGSSIDEQYEDIKYCLMTLEKYECNRLR